MGSTVAVASTAALVLGVVNVIGAANSLQMANQAGHNGGSSSSPDTKEAAEVAEGASSRILHISQRNLQKGFTKHGADFSLTGNWNSKRASEFSAAVNQHINSSGIQTITGTYRNNPAVHYLAPKTGLNVVADPAGNYISGWRLGAEQLESVLTTGRLW